MTFDSKCQQKYHITINVSQIPNSEKGFLEFYEACCILNEQVLTRVVLMWILEISRSGSTLAFTTCKFELMWHFLITQSILFQIYWVIVKFQNSVHYNKSPFWYSFEG